MRPALRFQIYYSPNALSSGTPIPQIESIPGGEGQKMHLDFIARPVIETKTSGLIAKINTHSSTKHSILSLRYIRIPLLLLTIGVTRN